jgi:hypothetical protein
MAVRATPAPRDLRVNDLRIGPPPARALSLRPRVTVGYGGADGRCSRRLDQDGELKGDDEK